MEKPKRHRWNIIAAVVIAALAVTTIYLGSELAQRPDRKEVAALIDARVAESAGLSASDFNARVEQGIVAFIEKQQRAEADRPNQLARNVPPPNADDHIYGDSKATVTLIEYSDFECPFCKRFHGTAKELIDSSNGQVNWVYRHFPLAFHNPGAQKQAEASECATELGGNDAFWRYTDAIYERTRSNGKGFPIDRLVPLAVEQDLDPDEFASCLESGRHTEKVQRQMAEGTRAGITGTPGNILYNNRTGEVIAVHGAQPLEQLQQAVRSLLSQSN